MASELIYEIMVCGVVEKDGRPHAGPDTYCTVEITDLRDGSAQYRRLLMGPRGYGDPLQVTVPTCSFGRWWRGLWRR